MADGRPRPMGTIVHLTPRDGRPRGRIIRLDTGPPGGPGDDGPKGTTSGRPRWPTTPAPVPLPSPPTGAVGHAEIARPLPLPGMEDLAVDRRGPARDGDRGPVTPRAVEVDEVSLMVTLGHQIAEHRKRLGLSQYSLAAAIHCDRSAVCRWESGNRMPSLVHLVALCQVLGCSPATLLAMDSGDPDGPAIPLPTHMATAPDGPGRPTEDADR